MLCIWAAKLRAGVFRAIEFEEPKMIQPGKFAVLKLYKIATGSTSILSSNNLYLINTNYVKF